MVGPSPSMTVKGYFCFVVMVGEGRPSTSFFSPLKNQKLVDARAKPEHDEERISL
jgi:hypothetical protein